MNAQAIQKQVLLLPRIQQLEVDSQTKKDVIDEWLQPTIDEISAAWEWDFVLGETTFPGGSTSGTAQYVLKGDATNALEIITIKYGSDGNVLKKFHPLDLDEFLHKRSHSATDIWVPDGRVNSFPQVRLVATPSGTSQQIKYRYRKNNITLTEFPDNFSRVVAMGVARNLDENLEVLYQRALDFMIDNYRATQVHERTAHLDPMLVMKNNRRASLIGYNG